MLPRSTALLIVDAQSGWRGPFWGALYPPGAEAGLGALVGAFRRTGRPVVHAQWDPADPHSPLNPSEPGHAFLEEALPREGEPVFSRRPRSPFRGTDLEAHLRDRGIDRLVIAGFMVHLAVASAVREARDLGFRILVAGDACGAHDLEDISGERIPARTLHQVALAELHGEFGHVLDVQSILEIL